MRRFSLDFMFFTNNFWAGLSSDLIIEKELMRNMKSTCGLTRGRDMTEVQ